MDMNVGEVTAVLKVRDEATAGFQKATAELQKMSGGMATATTASSTMGGALSRLTPMIMAYAGPAALGFAVKRTLEWADNLEEMSRQTGISIDRLQRLKYAVEQNGLGFEKMVQGIGQLQDRIAGGDKSAIAALDRFGLGWKEFAKLNTDDQIIALADHLGQFNSVADRTGALKDLFGRAGAEWGPALEELNKKMAEAPTLSADAIKGLAALNDWWARLGTSVRVATGELVSFLTTFSGSALANIGAKAGDPRMAAIGNLFYNTSAYLAAARGDAGTATEAKNIKGPAYQLAQSSGAGPAFDWDKLMASSKDLDDQVKTIGKDAERAAEDAERAWEDWIDRIKESQRDIRATTKYLGDQFDAMLKLDVINRGQLGAMHYALPFQGFQLPTTSLAGTMQAPASNAGVNTWDMLNAGNQGQSAAVAIGKATQDLAGAFAQLAQVADGDMQKTVKAIGTVIADIDRKSVV
jgi:hypothetical protein